MNLNRTKRVINNYIDLIDLERKSTGARGQYRSYWKRQVNKHGNQKDAPIRKVANQENN